MNRQNFIFIESKCAAVPDFLIQEVSGFSESDEYLRLDDEGKKSPGIVCGAFTSYFPRIYGEASNENTILDSAIRTVELLCELRDDHVENLIVTEIFENICFDYYPGLIQRLGDKSQVLYARWRE